MTESQKHAALLREWAEKLNSLIAYASGQADEAPDAVVRTAYIDVTRHLAEKILALLAGAEALEAQGRWWLDTTMTPIYLVPVDRWTDWHNWRNNREVGEASALVPKWVIAVTKGLVITGWRKP